MLLPNLIKVSYTPTHNTIYSMAFDNYKSLLYFTEWSFHLRVYVDLWWAVFGAPSGGRCMRSGAFLPLAIVGPLEIDNSKSSFLFLNDAACYVMD